MSLSALRFERQPGNQAYFQNLNQILIAHILEAEYIYGCVAWLTHVDIIRALKQKKCCIVINQENWNTPFRSKNVRDYAELTPIPLEYIQQLDRRLTPTKPGYVSPAIRSIGTPSGDPSSDPNQSNQMMHHKFLIMESRGMCGVWTGSFNMTHNATNSLENAIFCTDEHVVQEYKKEFVQMYKLSGELKDKWEPNMYYTFGPAAASPVAEPINMLQVQTGSIGVSQVPGYEPRAVVAPANQMINTFQVSSQVPSQVQSQVPKPISMSQVQPQAPKPINVPKPGSIDYERAVIALANQMIASEPAAPVRTPNYCTYCKKFGHVRDDCYTRKNRERAAANDEPEPGCPYCGGTDHTHTQCANNPSNIEFAASAASAGCAYCGLTNHKVTQCFKKRADEKRATKGK